MIDRLPLPGIAGDLSPFVGVDLPIGVLPVGTSLNRVTLVVTDPPSGGSVVAAVRTAAAGGGSAIPVTIADGTRWGEATASLVVGSGDVLYLRISAATGGAANLSGWLEIEAPALAFEPVAADAFAASRDRVPLPHVPGDLTPWVAVDLPVGTLPAGARLIAAWLSVTDPPSGGSVAWGVRTAPSGGGVSIDGTLADGQRGVYVVAPTPLVLGADTVVYLRITAESGGASNLSGYLEIETTGLAGAVGSLTTLGRVRRYLGSPPSADDVLLEELIAGVSAAWTWAVGREYVPTSVTERCASLGDEAIVLGRYPVVGIDAVLERGVALASTDYVLDGRLLYRTLPDGATPRLWTRNNHRGAVVVTYRVGLPTVPEQVVLAITMQVAHEYHQSAPGGGRLGMHQKGIQAGGVASYGDDNWLPFAKNVLIAEQAVELT